MSAPKRGAFEGTIDSVSGAIGLLWDWLGDAPTPDPDDEEEEVPAPSILDWVREPEVRTDETIETEGEEVP